jgi:ribonucleoside-diphosphate reductase alpha chain
MAWLRGLKTTYYLRSLSATSTEKSTVDRGNLNAVAAWQDLAPASAPTAAASDVASITSAAPADVPLACSIDDPDCEACQ